jgi:hypothetical protein
MLISAKAEMKAETGNESEMKAAQSIMAIVFSAAKESNQ